MKRSLILTVLALSSLALPAFAGERHLTNEAAEAPAGFYADYDRAFQAHWKAKTGEDVEVVQALRDDLVRSGPSLGEAAPFTTPIVFLVRRGNPKNLRSWDDLVRPGVHVVVANPKTSASGRHSYLAAWSHALRRSGGDEARADAFVRGLFANVPRLEVDSDGAARAFAEQRVGDVLLTFESEVGPLRREMGPYRFEAIYPPTTVVAELAVARSPAAAPSSDDDLGRAYREYLHSELAQVIGARYGLRPRSPAVAARFRDRFPEVESWTVAQVAGSWRQAFDRHFSNGGAFDRIYAAR